MFDKKDNDDVEKDELIKEKDKDNVETVSIKVTPGQPSKSDSTYEVEECEIKFIEKGKVYFEFKKKYTLVLPIDKSFDIKAKIIKIAYTGEIGKANFKYWIEK